MLATLRRRDFALVWLAGLISMMGDWVLYIALPIYVYQLTGSALATSAMFAAEMVPRSGIWRSTRPPPNVSGGDIHG